MSQVREGALSANTTYVGTSEGSRKPTQPRSAWTQELDLRPHKEHF